MDGKRPASHASSVAVAVAFAVAIVDLTVAGCWCVKCLYCIREGASDHLLIVVLPPRQQLHCCVQTSTPLAQMKTCTMRLAKLAMSRGSKTRTTVKGCQSQRKNTPSATLGRIYQRLAHYYSVFVWLAHYLACSFVCWLHDVPRRHQVCTVNTMWRELLYSGFETCFGPSTQGAVTVLGPKHISNPDLCHFGKKGSDTRIWNCANVCASADRTTEPRQQTTEPRQQTNHRTPSAD